MWQRALGDMIDSTRPELADLGYLSSALQLAFIDEAEARFLDRLDRTPDHLELDGGLVQFVNVGIAWTDADEAGLREQNADYRALQVRIGELRARSDGHADWPTLRALVQIELSASASYVGAAEQLQSVTSKLENRLAECVTE